MIPLFTFFPGLMQSLRINSCVICITEVAFRPYSARFAIPPSLCSLPREAQLVTLQLLRLWKYVVRTDEGVSPKLRRQSGGCLRLEVVAGVNEQF